MSAKKNYCEAVTFRLVVFSLYSIEGVASFETAFLGNACCFCFCSDGVVV